MRRLVLSMLVLSVVLTFSACTASQNPLVGTPNDLGITAGFLRGLWHGLIFPVAFVISLFSGGTSVYEVHNSGGWYNFGYLIGLTTLGSSLGLGGTTVVVSQPEPEEDEDTGNEWA